MAGVQVYEPSLNEKMSSEVYIIRLSSPPLNILNKSTRESLLKDLDTAVKDTETKMIIIVGSETAFSVGADINEMNQRIGKNQEAKQLVMESYVNAYKDTNLASIVYALDSCPKPIIALITGQCFGGGLELALGCQYRICTENSVFRFPETLIGIIPGALGTQLLPRLVSFDTAIKMCTGMCKMLNANEAKDAGLIDQILKIDENEKKMLLSNQRLESYISSTVRVLKRHIYHTNKHGNGVIKNIPNPFRRTSQLDIITNDLSIISRISYHVMQTLPPYNKGGKASRECIKCLIACVNNNNNNNNNNDNNNNDNNDNNDNNSDFYKGARIESDISRKLVVSDEAQALRWAFFAEKLATSTKSKSKSNRINSYGNSNSDSDSNGEVKLDKNTTVIGVIGSGTMGVGIAATCLLSGFKVILCDSNNKALMTGKQNIEYIIKNFEKKKKIKEGSSNVYIKNLHITTNINDYCEKKFNVNIVIEAVFEDINIKKTIFIKLDDICNEKCILCSNTSSLDIDIIAKATRRPNQVLGLHFFSPAHIMKLVEIVKCKHTDYNTISIIMLFVKNIKKIGVLVTNLPGFVGNRMIFVYAMEAMLLLENGASVSQVDGIMNAFGMAMGPFEMADLSGLDVGYKIRLSKGLVLDSNNSNNSDNDSDIDFLTKEQNKIGKQIQKQKQKQNLDPSYSAIGDILYKNGRLGSKNGKGFYKYVQSKGKNMRPVKQVDPVVDELIILERQRREIVVASQKKNQVSGVYKSRVLATSSPTGSSGSGSGGDSLINEVEILERLLFSLINEGFRLLGENGVLSNRPGDIDVIYNYGYGFPAYRGGPMFWIEYEYGLREFYNKLNYYYKKFPNSVWFEPAPLLIVMLRNNISLWQIQQNPSLVEKLMSMSQNHIQSKL